MPVREADAQTSAWVVSLIAHLRCDGDLQGVGTRNKLSYIGLRHFVARPMPRERASFGCRRAVNRPHPAGGGIVPLRLLRS